MVCSIIFTLPIRWYACSTDISNHFVVEFGGGKESDSWLVSTNTLCNKHPVKQELQIKKKKTIKIRMKRFRSDIDDHLQWLALYIFYNVCIGIYLLLFFFSSAYFPSIWNSIEFYCCYIDVFVLYIRLFSLWVSAYNYSYNKWIRWYVAIIYWHHVLCYRIFSLLWNLGILI